MSETLRLVPGDDAALIAASNIAHCPSHNSDGAIFDSAECKIAVMAELRRRQVQAEQRGQWKCEKCKKELGGHSAIWIRGQHGSPDRAWHFRALECVVEESMP